MKHIVALLGILLLFSGCSAVNIDHYQNISPTFNLFSYFHGEVKGWGIVQDRQGRLTRQFTVQITGVIDDEGNLVLDELFDWSDGEKSRRVWMISQQQTNGYRGKADDVIGEAKGVSAGNALNWRYVLNLTVDDRSWNINFDDWMFLQPDNVLINRAEMSKFGFTVGEVTIVFVKDDEGSTP